jgi:type VI secretion system secreted protein Hcp
MPLVPVNNGPTLAGMLATTPGTGSGYEVHLDLGQILGESNSSTHQNEIEVVSFSFGCSNSAVMSSQSGTSKGGKASVNEITVTKYTDKSSPQLFMAVCTCQTFKTAKISVSKSTGGKKPEDYLILTMQLVNITSWQLSSPSGGEMGTETLTFNFCNINIDYKMQTAMGILVSASNVSYNLKQGQ